MAEYLTQDVDLQTIANAIREKAGTSDALAFPAGFAEAIAAIQSGGGGDIRIETGTVTFASDPAEYLFLNENPDIFVVYSASEGNPTYNTRQGIWVWIRKPSELLVFGYNKGVTKYYTPFRSTNLGPQRCYVSGSDFNGKLIASASPYVWYAIWGVS